MNTIKLNITVLCLFLGLQVSAQTKFSYEKFSGSNNTISNHLNNRHKVIETLKQEIALYNQVKIAIKARKWYKALELFDTYKAQFNRGSFYNDIASQYSKIERKSKERGTNLAVFTYEYETGSFGVYSYPLSLKSPNFYIGLRANPDIFRAISSIESVNNDDLTSDGSYTPTGQVKSGNAAVSLGLTIKLAYPIWLNIGGGGGYNAILVEATDENSLLDDLAYLNNKDESKVYFFPEAGITLQLFKAIGLNYTAYYNETVFHQFGFGIQF